MNSMQELDLAISFDGDQMTITFDRFDAPTYRNLFLRAKRLPEYRIDLADEEAMSYRITAPARFAPMLGIQTPVTEACGIAEPDWFYDDQTAIVRMAIAAKRFACWSDCGLGKTFIESEFARQVHARTGGRVLIITLNDIVPQWLEMVSQRYGASLPVVRLETREAMRQWCVNGTIDGAAVEAKVAITNYEKFNHSGAEDQVVNECRHLAGFVLDESSRLKGGGGKQKWAIIKSAKGVAYKLSCTATPAPNELIEFASQASFLETMRSESISGAMEQIIWTYFTRDPVTHRWSVKKHARAAFFEWMSSWSIYVRDPRRYGWRKNVPTPPAPERFVHLLQPTSAQRDFVIEFNAKAPPPAGDQSGTPSMFVDRVNATIASKLSQAAKGFVYGASESGRRIIRPIDSLKPAFVADLICREARSGLQVLVWTVFDEEAAILDRLVRERSPFRKSRESLDLLNGATRPQQRLEILDRFRHGHSSALISRADMLGYGLNFQNCGSMIFSGWSFSYEQFYQAIRRAFRHGQTRSVRIHIPVIPELEGQMFEAIGRKEAQHESAILEMEANYIAAVSRVTEKPKH